MKAPDPRQDARRAWGLGCGSLVLAVLALVVLAYRGPVLVRPAAAVALGLLVAAGYWSVVLTVVVRFLGLGSGLLAKQEVLLRGWIARFARDPEGLWIRWAGQVANAQLGLTCLERAAALGPRGQLELGLAWAERSLEELAIPCFRRAAELGSAQAMGCLVESLRWGPQRLRDEAEALAWEARLSELGTIEARSRSVLRGGTAGPEGPRRGPGDLLDLLWERPWMPWLCLSGVVLLLPVLGVYLAILGLVFAPLVWVLMRVVNGPSRGVGGSIKRLLARAEGGDAAASLALAKGYLEGGKGLPKDPLSAQLWFRRAAEAGEPEAMAILAQMLATGHGSPADPPQARDWYVAAAQAGHAGASDWLRSHPRPSA